MFATLLQRRGALVPIENIPIEAAPADGTSRAQLATYLCREALHDTNDRTQAEYNKRCNVAASWNAVARLSDTNVAQVTPLGPPDVRILGICQANSWLHVVYGNSGAQVPGTV